jgi:hypothetical protein
MKKIMPRNFDIKSKLEALRPLLKSRKFVAIAVAAIFGVIGIVFITASSAATYVVSLEAEAGTISGKATKSTNTSASNSSSVAFGSDTYGGAGITPPTPPPASGTFAGPLKVSSNSRYLVDQNNTPFFWTADTCWSCLTTLSVADAKKYIDLRKAQGFNTIMTNIVFPERTRSGPHGTAFTGDDLTKPNEAYFTAVDQIIDYANTQGIIMYVGTLWMADNGGRVGGRLPSTSEFQSYASYLANRYKSKPNIVWYVGGDDEPSRNFGSVQTMGNALSAADPNHLISYHTWGKASNAAGQSWLDFNSMQWNSNSSPYSYADIRELLGYSPAKPAFDMEPAYDPTACCGSDTATSEQENRRNGWWAVLSGAMGVAYGGPRATWFAGEGGAALDTNSVNRNAARHTGNINKIMSGLNWQLLAPDWNNAAVTGGRGSYGGTDYAAAARASDGSLIVAYIPQGGSLTVNLTQLSGSGTAQWYDPSTGSATGSATAVSNSGSQTFNTPGNSDYVLVVKR